VLHYENAETPRLQATLASEALSEQGARIARVERLRGAPLQVPVHVKGGHPSKWRSHEWVMPPRAGPPSESNYRALLMRIDTERTKLSAQLQVSETFSDNGKAIIRLLLAATPSERPGILAGLQRLADETNRLSNELKKKPKKRKTTRVLPPPKRAAKRARAAEHPSSDDEDDEEESDEEGSDDDDAGGDSDEPDE